MAASSAVSVPSSERQHAPVDEALADLDLGGHLGQPEPGVLERGDGLAEGGALLDVGERPVERGASRRHAGRRDRQALLGQVGDQVGEALALLAQQVGGRHLHVGEEQLGGVLGVHPDLGQVAAALEARHAPLQDQQRHAGVALATGRSSPR
jgi:hypothetical protein